MVLPFRTRILLYRFAKRYCSAHPRPLWPGHHGNTPKAIRDYDYDSSSSQCDITRVLKCEISKSPDHHGSISNKASFSMIWSGSHEYHMYYNHHAQIGLFLKPWNFQGLSSLAKWPIHKSSKFSNPSLRPSDRAETCASASEMRKHLSMDHVWLCLV